MLHRSEEVSPFEMRNLGGTPACQQCTQHQNDVELLLQTLYKLDCWFFECINGYPRISAYGMGEWECFLNEGSLNFFLTSLALCLKGMFMTKHQVYLAGQKKIRLTRSQVKVNDLLQSHLSFYQMFIIKHNILNIEHKHLSRQGYIWQKFHIWICPYQNHRQQQNH